MSLITKRMRIGIDVTPLQTGHQYRGVGTYVRNLVINLASIDSVNQYHLFCLNEMPEGFRDLGPNFKLELIHVPRIGKFAPLLSHQILVPRRVREQRLDIFHTPFVPTFIATPGLPVLLGCARVTTIHDLVPLATRPIYGSTLRGYLYYRLMLQRAKSGSAIIVDSESTRTCVIQYLGVDVEKIKIVYLAAEPFFQRLDSEKTEGLFRTISKRWGIAYRYVLYVGDLSVVKNPDGLLEALALVSKSGLAGDLQLVVVGKTMLQHMERLQGKIQYLGLSDKVIFTDYIEKQDLMVLYNRAVAFVFPSFQEGFGLPLLEAMACGAPIIAARRSSIPELAEGVAILFDPSNPQEIARALCQVLANEELRESMRRKGYDRVKTFTWGKTARLTLEVYQDVFRTQMNKRANIS